MNETSLKLRNTIETFIQTAQFDALIETCKMALGDARERGDKSTEVLSVIGLAQGHKYIGKFKEARVLVDGAVRFAAQIGDNDLQTMALSVRGSLYLMGFFQPYDAEHDWRQALDLAERHQNPDLLADVLLGLAATYQQTNENERSESYARKAFNIARKASNRHLMGVALALIGAATMGNQPEKAMQAYEDALAIAQQDNYRLLELTLTSNIGALLCREKRYAEEGQMMLEKAVALAKDFRSVPHEFTALYRLGRALEKQGALERAAQYYGLMLERAQEWRVRSYEGVGFFNLGILAYHRAHHDDAIANLEQALMIARETKNPFQEAQIEQTLAANYLVMDNFDDSLEHYKAARSLYDALDNRPSANRVAQKILLVYIERLLDNVLRWLGLRQDEAN